MWNLAVFYFFNLCWYWAIFCQYCSIFRDRSIFCQPLFLNGFWHIPLASIRWLKLSNFCQFFLRIDLPISALALRLLFAFKSIQTHFIYNYLKIKINKQYIKLELACLNVTKIYFINYKNLSRFGIISWFF